MIVNAGISRIVYESPYPDPVAERLLRDAAIDLARVQSGESVRRG
jgi:deoxycytidylate deaminase